MSTSLRLVHDRTGRLAPEAIKALADENPRAAYDAVVRKYRERIFYHAVGIVKDYQEAYDVTQEVFIKAMRETRFFNEGFKMKAWLFRVTTNLCFNIVRDRKRRGAILETIQRPKSTRADQADVVMTDEHQQHILEGMDKLTKNHREILMLRYYQDLSYAEIAGVLDIKLGTVMSRLSRAKRKLMEVIDDPRVVEG